MINGMIIVDKEAGFTSHDVVAKLRGICGQRKIGHTGTLDPAATGVLPVMLGSATKLCDMLTEKDKEYVAELLLGVRTDTQDTTGQVLSRQQVEVTSAQVEEACASFVGVYDQVPPMYSALKVDGKKLYELARAGKEVERAARRVEIHAIEILRMELPLVTMRVACSKGTYIRTLCADIGEKLQCGGTMQSLRRTRVGNFDEAMAHPLSEIQEKKDAGNLSDLVIPISEIFADVPKLHVRQESVFLLENGNPIFANQTEENFLHAEGEWVQMCRPDGSMAGIYAYLSEKKRYQPVKMFLERE